MPTNLDRKMLTGFAQEACGYVEQMRAGIASFLHDASQADGLQGVSQHVQAIKGAAELLELSVLSQLTAHIQEMVAAAARAPQQVDARRGAFVRHAVNQLEQYLTHWLSDEARARAGAMEIVIAFRRFQGLSATGDQAAVAELCTVHPGLAGPTGGLSPASGTARRDPGPQQHADTVPQDEAPDELIDGFLLEAEDHLNAVGRLLPGLSDAAAQRDGIQQVQRSIHTFKGAAGVVGFSTLAQLAHRMEDLLDDLCAENRPFTPQVRDLLLATFDALDEFVRARGQVEHFDRTVQALYDAYGAMPDPTPETEAVAPTPTPVAVAPAALESSPVARAPEAPEEPAEALDDIIDGFLLEAADLLKVVAQALPDVDATPARRDQVQQVRRSIHTFKGAAGVVGFPTASALARHMQDRLDAILEGECPLTPSLTTLFLATYDALDEFVRARGQSPTFDQTALTLTRAYDSMLAAGAAEAVMPPAADPTPEADAYVAASVPEVGAAPSMPCPEEPAGAGGAPVASVLRVPLERVDELVGLVSELVISRSAYEQHLGRLTQQVDELRLSIERLRRTTTTVETQYEVRALADNQGRLADPAPVSRVGLRSATSGTAHEFDALEFDRYSEFTLVARELTETTADIGALGQEFGDVVGDFDSYLTRQARLTSAIQDRLMRLRMVPFATLATRLQRAVRVTARQRHKDAHLVLEGEDVEFDKTVLEAIAEPLLHMLRNAVDHGLETPEQRQALGKPPQGTIHLRALREGTQVVLQMRDDGAGLNVQQLRATAVRCGGLSAEEAARLPQEELYGLIFTPGFSTTSEVSEVSGRGVGMDVVQTTVKRLKGQVHIDSVPGQGVTFTIRLPLTLAITRVFLVKTHGETFAIPLADVTQIVRLEAETIERVDDTPVLRLNGQTVPVLRLGEQLGLPPTSESPPRLLPMVVVQAGDRQVAFVVDQLLGGREVVVKTLGSHLRRVQGVIGCTLLGDGSVVLILNALELARHALQHGNARPAVVQPRSRPHTAALEVLIVDDSFSVRRVVSNLIKSAGWHPTLAKDGLEALESIQRAATPPDLILLDVEMPQMDGYELTSTLRAHAAYRDIPIVMLTSRAGEKHRRKALEVGASDYLVKPYQDETLLGVIRRLVPGAGDAVAA